MLTDRQRLRLEHIVENAERISGYVAGLSYEGFADSPIAIDAVERCLARITEAAIRIGAETMAAVAPTVPPHVYRGFGNAPRHDYDQLDLRTIWLTATKDVPLRAAACGLALGAEGST